MDLIWTTKIFKCKVGFGFRCNRFWSSAFIRENLFSNTATEEVRILREGHVFRKNYKPHTVYDFRLVLENKRMLVSRLNKQFEKG
jgi:hypothetical protein